MWLREEHASSDACSGAEGYGEGQRRGPSVSGRAAGGASAAGLTICGGTKACGAGAWLLGLDALCLILMFAALGVAADPRIFLVAYGIATTLAAIPLTPGGIGAFEATMLATLALLGVGSEAAIPILGYRLFNFWLPIALAAVFYPTLRHSGQDHSLGRG